MKRKFIYWKSYFLAVVLAIAVTNLISYFFLAAEMNLGTAMLAGFLSAVFYTFFAKIQSNNF